MLARDTALKKNIKLLFFKIHTPIFLQYIHQR